MENAWLENEEGIVLDDEKETMVFNETNVRQRIDVLHYFIANGNI